MGSRSGVPRREWKAGEEQEELSPAANGRVVRRRSGVPRREWKGEGEGGEGEEELSPAANGNGNGRVGRSPNVNKIFPA